MEGWLRWQGRAYLLVGHGECVCIGGYGGECIAALGGAVARLFGGVLTRDNETETARQEDYEANRRDRTATYYD
jgi:hypothetical protein